MLRVPHVLSLAWIVLAIVLQATPVDAQSSVGEFARVQTVTAELRGLEQREAVPSRVLDGAAMRGVLQAEFEQEWADRHLARRAAAWVILGLLPTGFDVHSALLSSRESNVLGFYRTQDRTMYLLDDPTVAPTQRDVVLAHEYTHALQDQYFGLDVLLPTPPKNNDIDLARLALIEGDATVTMLRFAEATLSSEELAQLGDSGPEVSDTGLAPLPPVLQSELTFPYVEGSAFVYSMLATGTINSVFRHPPDSTEQILHPSRYFSNEAPADVQVPDVSPQLGSGWEARGGDVLGEFGIRTLLEGRGERSRAALAAEGWGGDRWELFEDRSGRQAFVLETLWDEVEDAHQFFDALAADTDGLDELGFLAVVPRGGVPAAGRQDARRHERAEKERLEHGSSRASSDDGPAASVHDPVQPTGKTVSENGPGIEAGCNRPTL